MAFIAKSITAFYSEQEDRLGLIFNDKAKNQLAGSMTRQLFKGLLAQLPEWLAKQYSDAMPCSTEQQQEINHIQHEVSLQKATVTYGEMPRNEQLETFLIGNISFTKVDLEVEDYRIQLVFQSLDKVTEIVFVLNSEQLHKLMDEMLKQVKAWDINNPWQEKSTTFTLSDTKGGMLH